MLRAIARKITILDFSIYFNDKDVGTDCKVNLNMQAIFVFCNFTFDKFNGTHQFFIAWLHFADVNSHFFNVFLVFLNNMECIFADVVYLDLIYWFVCSHLDTWRFTVISNLSNNEWTEVLKDVQPAHPEAPIIWLLHFILFSKLFCPKRRFIWPVSAPFVVSPGIPDLTNLMLFTIRVFNSSWVNDGVMMLFLQSIYFELFAPIWCDGNAILVLICVKDLLKLVIKLIDFVLVTRSPS